MVVKATDYRLRCDAAFVLDGTMDRCVFAKGPPPAFRTIQGALKYVPRGLGHSRDTDDVVLKPKETWRCRLAGHVVERPRLGPLFARNAVAEAYARNHRRGRWNGQKEITGGDSTGQCSNPFRSRPPGLGFIAPSIPNPLLFGV